MLARRDLTAYARQRAECIRFLDRGRSVAEVADLLECHQVTVRAAVHRFVDGGIAGLPLPCATGYGLSAGWRSLRIG
ncbi:helix-turn-helix domain-containing protein [Streptomyces acidiscabies]|uniref:helix-turn-helix domain-containing protein n=1 Tax=Streptomyces acidiscabies TaxID=42234 RepID=UPI003BB1BD60